MTPSSHCYSLIQKFEGLRTTAYLCPAGVWTIGYGHTQGVKEGDVITADMAAQYLKEDLEEAVGQVNALMTSSGVELTQGQFDALVSFVFNLGIGNLRGSTLWRKICVGDFKAAAEQFQYWIKAAGRITPGLVKRRAAERALFES